MIENFNKIINNKSFEKVGSLTVIQHKNFLNEVVRSHDLMGLTFAHQSDLVRANFIESDFTDCHFDIVNMAGAVFTQCEFIQPKFHKVPSLESVTLFGIQKNVSKSILLIMFLRLSMTWEIKKF